MRSALLALCLVGCIEEPNDGGWQPSSNDGWGSGWGGGGGNAGFGCHADSDCGSTAICARTGECLAASQVHIVHTTWTINGAAASVTTCANSPDLSITFYAPDKLGNDQFGFTPVPCKAGKFTIDKMPLRYESVELTRRDDYGTGAFGDFDATGNASLVLHY